MAVFTLFGSIVKKPSDQVSKVSGFKYDPKTTPPLWIIWINNAFLDFSKGTKYICFWITNLDLDISKEMHPYFLP